MNKTVTLGKFDRGDLFELLKQMFKFNFVDCIFVMNQRLNNHQRKKSILVKC
jgi:hypothetical protein